MRIITYLIVVIILFFGISFAALNANSVSVNYYFGTSSIPLCILLVLVFVIGCLVGMMVGLWLLLKAKLTNHKIKQRLVLAEKEIDNLRAIPLQDKV